MEDKFHKALKNRSHYSTQKLLLLGNSRQLQSCKNHSDNLTPYSNQSHLNAENVDQVTPWPPLNSKNPCFWMPLHTGGPQQPPHVWLEVLMLPNVYPCSSNPKQELVLTPWVTQWHLGYDSHRRGQEWEITGLVLGKTLFWFITSLLPISVFSPVKLREVG
jgi:hypothetical protein